MHAAHEAHIPVLTPTFVLFEDDPACFTDADALMFGPSLLAAPVASPGCRAVEVYLPRGPECWRDFWTGAVYAPGQTVVVEAPLEGLPLLAPAGASVATTDAGKDYSRLHDEPSRALLVYPGELSGRSSAVIYEDDGITLDGPLTKVTIMLEWSEAEVRIAVSAQGDYELLYREMRVVLPEGEGRMVRISGDVEGRIELAW